MTSYWKDSRSTSDFTIAFLPDECLSSNFYGLTRAIIARQYFAVQRFRSWLNDTLFNKGG